MTASGKLGRCAGAALDDDVGAVRLELLRHIGRQRDAALSRRAFAHHATVIAILPSQVIA